MKPSLLQFDLPEGCRVLFNTLWEDDKGSPVSEDLVAIKLPGGLCLDVGWYPEAKEYSVVVFGQHWQDRRSPCLSTSQPQRVKALVELLARAFKDTPL